MFIPELQAGVGHTFDTIDQAAMVLPAFLQETNYKIPTDPKHCPFQRAMRTEDSAFEWFLKHPEPLNNFNTRKIGQRVGRACWLDFFRFEERLADGFTGGEDDVMLVDAGGLEATKYEPSRLNTQMSPDGSSCRICRRPSKVHLRFQEWRKSRMTSLRRSRSKVHHLCTFNPSTRR